ncbi:transporter substrate-binding domain-containing protein [Rhizobium leguminosarum bv. viciae]|nr:transporter substrate-binding domain-containing protein [Rhizobium leguminosarum]NKK53534.1 transporter substrate-binding domain-containing protein [Rhizobium leguminosarum bv. viciae]MBY5345258.1 transporter substrate-binding domain-containing protein [Rhizobium leguminosarum]MBY5376138.1 transporter substrate-binding domain-containing protein [Rhizobium leguminosarum]MBY5392398.1 transporter substrate-binding domain-containing protein [Rhizobium leguminosarum]
MQNFTRRLFLAATMGLAVAVGAGSAMAAERTLAAIKADGVIKIGVEGVFAPFSYRENGVIVGYDVDLAEMMFKDLGVKPEFVDTQWSGIVPALLSSKFDIIMSSLSYTKERMQKVNFSIPYADSSLAMLVRAADEGTIKSFDDMSGKPIAIKAGTPEEASMPKFNEQVEKAKGNGFGEVKVFDSEPMSILALNQGTVDGVISNMTNLGLVIKNAPGKYALVQKVAGSSLAGIGIRKEDEELRKYIDEQLLAATKSGKLMELQTKWFGVAFDMPTTVPVME